MFIDKNKIINKWRDNISYLTNIIIIKSKLIYFIII